MARKAIVAPCDETGWRGTQAAHDKRGRRRRRALAHISNRNFTCCEWQRWRTSRSHEHQGRPTARRAETRARSAAGERRQRAAERNGAPSKSVHERKSVVGALRARQSTRAASDVLQQAASAATAHTRAPSGACDVTRKRQAWPRAEPARRPSHANGVRRDGWRATAHKQFDVRLGGDVGGPRVHMNIEGS